jgi:hypothetical protein
VIGERDRIERIDHLLARLQQDSADSVRRTGRRARIVEGLLQIFALLMALLALSNLYFVNDLTQEVRLVVIRMDEMTEYFARVAGRMTDMRREVARMETNVRMLPVIDAQIIEIATHVGAMEDGVSRIEQSAGNLAQRVDAMSTSVGDMAIRFRGLNQSVGAMGIDVDQMARPVP